MLTQCTNRITGPAVRFQHQTQHIGLAAGHFLWHHGVIWALRLIENVNTGKEDGLPVESDSALARDMLMTQSTGGVQN